MAEPFFLSAIHERLLYGDTNNPLGLFHLYKASAEQLGRMRRYSPKSIKRIKALLHTLAGYDYVRIDQRPTADYRPPYSYVLGNRGIEYAKSIGYAVSDSYRPSKEIGQSYLHLSHTLGVNDVLISAALLKWDVPGSHLAMFKLKRDLAKHPFHTLWHGKTKDLIPDAFFDLRQLLSDGHEHQTPVFIELDRGSEQEEFVRWKAHAYATMIGTGWYKEQFTINSITIIFITFEGEKRRGQLRGWIREELHDEDQSIAASFLFATQPQPPEARVWVSPCFYLPFVENEPVAVLRRE